MDESGKVLKAKRLPIPRPLCLADLRSRAVQAFGLSQGSSLQFMADDGSEATREILQDVGFQRFCFGQYVSGHSLPHMYFEDTYQCLKACSIEAR